MWMKPIGEAGGRAGVARQGRARVPALALLATLGIWIALVPSVSAGGGLPSVRWHRQLGPVDPQRGGNAGGAAVQETADRGFISAGWYNRLPAGETTPQVMYVVKTDAEGRLGAVPNPGWESLLSWRQEEGTESRATGVRQMADGGYIVSGVWTTQQPPFVDLERDVVLAKLHPGGFSAWKAAYGGDQVDVGESAALLADGGYVVAGWTRSFSRSSSTLPRPDQTTGADDAQIYVVRTTTAGRQDWARAFGGPGDDRAVAVEETPDGGCLVVGTATTFNQDGSRADPEIAVLKLDAGGHLEWQQLLGGGGIEEGRAGIPTADGGYFIAGTTALGNVQVEGQGLVPIVAIVIVKLDAEGTPQREGIVRPVEIGQVLEMDLEPTSDGGAVAALTVMDWQAGRPEAQVVRITAAGDIVWQLVLSRETGLEAFAPQDIEPTSDGGYIVTGEDRRGPNVVMGLVRLAP